MYDYIKGTLVKITAKYIVIEANGLGYIVTVANPYSFSDQMNQTIQVYLHQVIRDDAHLLFGFHTEDEKEVFLKLISVSGIGPTTALAIVAVEDNQGLVAAVDNSDIKYLMKFPKIGKKTAQQMVLDLAGKFAELPPETTKATPNQPAELSKAIQELADNTEKREQFGKASVKRQKELFSLQSYIRNFSELYKKN